MAHFDEDENRSASLSGRDSIIQSFKALGGDDRPTEPEIMIIIKLFRSGINLMEVTTIVMTILLLFLLSMIVGKCIDRTVPSVRLATMMTDDGSPDDGVG